MNTIITREDLRKLQQRHRSLTGLLELILRRVELKPGAYKAIERHYREKTTQLKGCPWLRKYDLEMEPQGSVSTQTTVAPLERKHAEFDVDLVLKVIMTTSAGPFTAAQLHERVGNRLRVEFADILSSIRLGWTLDYAEAEKFHFDIVAATPWVHSGILMIAATDWKNNAWKATNPETYAKRFLKTAEELPYIEDIMERHNAFSEGAVIANDARVIIAPLPENTVVKLPLQRSVQFAKRFRDVWFAQKKRLKQRTPSIVISTLLWRAYETYVVGRSFPSMVRFSDR